MAGVDGGKTRAVLLSGLTVSLVSCRHTRGDQVANGRQCDRGAQIEENVMNVWAV